MFPAHDPRFRVRFITVDPGYTIRVVETGDAAATEVVVCLHGWACSSYSFAGVLPAVAARGARGVAFDLIGHGLSDKPDDAKCYTLDAMTDVVARVVEALGISRAAFVGHSMGGAIAARYAVRYPERVRRLVLAAPVGVGNALPLRLAIGCTPRIMNPLLPYLVPGWAIPIVLRMAFGALRRPTREDREEYWAPTQFPAFFRAMRALLHGFDWRAGERSGPDGLAGITVPTTLLYGSRDHFVVHDTARRYARIIPHVTVEEIPGCGHVVPEEVPELVANVATDGAPVGQSRDS